MRRVLHRGRVAAAIVAAAVLAPIEYSSQGLRVSEAACSDGTCCPEPKADCIINNILVENAHRKVGEGKCSQLQPNLPG
ncbi:MAG TPA: hypothetical protein VHG91_21650 [Longimicrobium sp.]|nr:hypothetical protein [Longimicrobium sp.]